MTVTLYNKAKDGWQRRVLRDVWASWSQGLRHTGGIAQSDGTHTQLLIPWREDYAAPEEFLEDPTGRFTLQLGDGVLPGVGEEAGEGHLRESVPGAQIICEVTFHGMGSDLDHWEVEAR